MQEYVNDIGKMALALTSGQLAKTEAVDEHGVGEELATHFLGWVDDVLGLICQMGDKLSRQDKEERLKASASLCRIMRHYWWVTGLTMVSEGYCSLDKYATSGMELSEAFTDPTKPVVECLTVIHTSIDEDGNASPASMVAAPYRVGVGRVVMWNDILVYPEQADGSLKNAKYPKMLRKSLLVEPIEDVSHFHLIQARDEINDLGFLMQEFFEI
jgi:hypothetical protein